MSEVEIGRQDPLNALRHCLDGCRRLVVFSHLNPDPDTVGSAVGLAWFLREAFGLEVHACYRGMIGRAENREMMRTVGREVRHASQLEFATYDGAFLVDAQPHWELGVQDAGPPMLGVIDHHPRGPSNGAIPFLDIREDYGSTSTIVTEYIRAGELEPPAEVCTALFYGLKTDTMGLSRRASDADRDAFEWLQQRIDRKILCRIENPPLSREYFERFVGAISRAMIYHAAIVSEIGSMPYPDMVAEVADRLLQLEGVEWSVVFGIHDQRIYLSVRTTHKTRDAGDVVKEVLAADGVGGGHDTMAAGQVQLVDDSDETYVRKVSELWLRFLEVLGEEASRGRRLVTDREFPQRIFPA